MRSPVAFSYYLDRAKGTAQKGIYLSKLKNLPFSLPPLKEQNLIVKKVEALMTLCNQLEEGINKNQKSSEVFMEVVLKETFAY